MSETDHERWQDIVEREMLGERLESDELAFRADFERDNPSCRRESEAWTSMLGALADEEGVSDGLSRAGALAQRVLVQRDVERRPPPAVVLPLRGRLMRPLARRTAIVATLALAAAATVLVLTRGDGQPAADQAATRSAPAMPEAPASTPTPSEDEAVPPAGVGDGIGRLAMAGVGARIDGGRASAGAELHPGQTLDFDPGTSGGADACVVSHSPWIATCFSRSSRAVFGPNLEHRELELARGRIVVDLDPLPAGQSFSVVTAKGSIAAVGTAFEVWIDEQGTVRASVLHGTVRVRDAVGSRLVQAGETARLGEPGIGRLEADALAWSRAHVDLASLWRSQEPGLLRIHDQDASSSPSSITFDALSVGQAPLSMLAPTGRHLIAVAGSTESRSVEIEAGATRDLTFAGAPVALPARPERKQLSPKPSAEELVRQASEAWRSHRYRDAARLLERLIALYPDGPDAQNARVELADLLQAKLGDAKRALQLYDAYLQRGGPLTPEARYGRVRALQRLDRPSEERAAIESFLARHPTDWRGKELRARLHAL